MLLAFLPVTILIVCALTPATVTGAESGLSSWTTRLDVRSDKRHALHLGNLPRASNNRAFFAYLVRPR